MTTDVERIERYQWKTPDGTRYVLSDIPSECVDCGATISETHYGYFRNVVDGPLEELCWNCGKEVTGFGDD